MGETYAGLCSFAQSEMVECARSVDSRRTECTKSYGTLTAWPGPCECTYFSQDLECFDYSARCASQVWSQIPQWYRDGVTTCLAKDAKYSIDARLGTFSNPFTVSGLAGQQTRTSTAGPGPTSSLPTQTTSPGAEADRLSGGAIAGIVIGSLAGLSLILGSVYFLWRRRRQQRKTMGVGESDDTAFTGMGAKPELDGNPVTQATHETEAKEIHEMPIKESCQELDAPRTYNELAQPEQHQRQQEPAELCAESTTQLKMGLPQTTLSSMPVAREGAT